MLPFGVNFANAELSTIREVSTNANTDLRDKGAYNGLPSLKRSCSLCFYVAELHCVGNISLSIYQSTNFFKIILQWN